MLAPRGMVCSVDHLASSAGVAMLRAGGSAADAAVAASAVLAVTTQHMCGMGGDLFALVSAPGGEPPAALQSAGAAGSGADPDRLRAEGHAAMPFRGDIRSVPVPGCVDGWVALHQRFGRLPLAEVLEPAAGYAEWGFPAGPLLAASAPAIAEVPRAADFLPGGALPRTGTRIRRPGLARALEAIGDGGRAAFYQGEFGEGLLAIGGGEYQPGDLAAVQARWVEPLAVAAWGRTIWTVPPPSQGYLTLAAAWLADHLDLPDPDDPRWAHLLVEASRQAAYDRPAVLHERADGAAMLAPERLRPRLAAIDPQQAASLGGRFDPGGTIYLCAVDEDRMGVSLIQSNAAGWGAHLVEPGTGIFLQNRGIGFSLEPGHPAEYGPRRRPPHTLSPALVTTDFGRLDTVLGTMGGDSQPQVVLQLLARLLAAGQSPDTAIPAGRFALAGPDGSGGFETWTAGGRVRVQVENTVPRAWIDGLLSRGHAVDVQAPGHGFGHAHAIQVRVDHLAGAADPRAISGTAAAW